MQQDLTALIEEAYQQYFLDIYGKKIVTPYRINIPYQGDRRKYGKSNPQELIQNTLAIAKEESFNLETATEDQIKTFMKKNMLGIDCSGFIYHISNFILDKLGKPTLEEIGLPKASSTNALKLLDDEFTDEVTEIDDIRPGDLIKFNKGSDEDIAHIMMISEVTPQEVTYIQSTEKSSPDGIQKKKIKIVDPKKGLKEQEWEEILFTGKNRSDYFNPKIGDGVRRLKVLS